MPAALYSLRIRSTSEFGKLHLPGSSARLRAMGHSASAGTGDRRDAARLSSPRGIALDGNGNLLIADTFNRRIRIVTPDGVIATIAGNGAFAFPCGDGGLATSASINGTRLRSP